MKLPDYLSRIQPTQGEEIELDVNIYTVNISAQKQINLQEATDGWPDDVKHTPNITGRLKNACQCKMD